MEQQPFGPINADFNHALLLIQRGDFAAAVPLLEKVVREDDRDAEAYHMLGLCQRKLERYDEALRSDGRALAIEPHHRGAHAAIGETYLALNQPAKAKEHLAVLDADCWFGCTEYDALKAAIARYEAKGGS
jgi:tetratricopeptide (TPR) repeat protein